MVVIAIPGDPESARGILTRGRRIARNFALEWVAVRILDPSIASDRREETDDLSEVVSALGGHLLCAEGKDVVRGLIEVASRERSRVLVIGRSRRAWILRRLKRGTTERLLWMKRPFDVVVAAAGADR